MPDQRMHDLWINSERARGHKRCEVHDIRFIDSETVFVLDGDEDAEKLAVILRRAASVSVCSSPRAALVESSHFVENDGRMAACYRARRPSRSGRTSKYF